MRYISTLFFILFLSVFAVGQKISVDSIQKIIRLKKNDTTHVNLLISILREHLAPSQVTEIQQLADEAIALSETLNYPKGMVSATLIKSRPLIMTGKFQEAEAILLPIVAVAKKANLYTQLGSIENNLGIVCQNTGRKEIATQHLIEAADAFGKAKNYALQAAVLGNLGSFFLQNNQLEKANEYLEKAYNANIIIKDTLKAGYFLLNQGIVWKRKKNLEAAENTFSNVLKISNQYPKDIELAFGVQSNLGELKAAKNDLANAQNYHFEALKIAQQLKSKDKTALTYQHLANILLKKGDFFQAEKYINDALFLAKQTNEKHRLIDIFAVAADIKNAIGKKDEAYTLLQTAQLQKDSVGSLSIQTAMNELEIKYQTAQKNEQIIAQQLALTQQKLYFFLLFTAFFLGIASFLYYRFRQQQQMRNLAQQQAIALLEASGSLPNCTMPSAAYYRQQN
jgi:two-component system, NarL family, sensor kinase